MTKIAIATTRHGAQDDRIYFKQALSLAKRMRVTLIAPDDGDNLTWPDEIEFHPIPRRVSPLGRLRSVGEAIRAVRSVRPGFCHLHDLDLVLAIPILRIMTNAKIIYDSHEVFTKDDLMMNHRLPKFFRRCIAAGVAWAERQLTALSDCVVTAVDPFDRAFAGLSTRQRTVFNYPPLNVFAANPADLIEARARYRGLLPIIYQGSMGRDRGLIHMLEALSLVKAREPRVVLRLVGMKDRRLRKSAEDLAVNLGVDSHVEFEGWLPHKEIAVAMQSSLIGLVPLQPCQKYQRALPIKLLEYMACGLPVIAAKLGLVERYVAESGCGLLYDSTRPDELARCVLELLGDAERRRMMGDAGLRAVRVQWNWGEMEKVLFEVYESLGARFEDAGA